MARKGRTALVSIAIFIGVTGTIALFSMRDILVGQLKQDIKENELMMAQVAVVPKEGVQPDNVATMDLLDRQPGVTEVQAGMEDRPIYFKTSEDAADFEDGFVQAYVVLNADGTQLLDAPFDAPANIEPYRLLEGGAWPALHANELLIERRTADEYKLKVGDTLYVRVLSPSHDPARSGETGTVEAWKISGVVFDPYGTYPKTSIYTRFDDGMYLAGLVGFNDIWLRFTDYGVAQDRTDVVVDLIGYRLYGHSEIDDPTITQPLLYRKIQERQPLWQSFAAGAGLTDEDLKPRIANIRGEFEASIEQAKERTRRPVMRQLPDYWSDFYGGRYRPEFEIATGLDRDRLAELAEKVVRHPEGFHVHPKVQRLLEQRLEMGRGERPLDYGMAEALAFASIVEVGHPVRISGQDSRRGTFNQRHSYLIDVENGEEYCPLQHVAPDQGSFTALDSMLSEAAVLGFEYGYSRDFPEALVLWEAQFGDFANGAQVITDQFITAAEDKWELLSGLVVLLPHGYEGQGPEHSSARIERFLQLAARDNVQIAQPSTAGQYFHLLRRQALRKWRKPLIVFTPKSMLRHPNASSDLAELESSRFRLVRSATDVEDARRILLCTGKVGHELEKERQARKDATTDIVFVEQLYPFPEQELREVFERHSRATEVVWVQEEPANMGALFFVEPRIRRLAAHLHFRSVKRSATGTPATGSAKAHQVEQKTLLTLAFARLG